jgi:4-amino-4-deoxy-L-arabinose transferase-like glycosyltransferase
LSQHLSEQNKWSATRTSLLLLLVFASFFALYKSNSAYTSDEVWSVKAASLDYGSEMEVLKADVHPPLYYQLLYLWIRLFGTGEREVRSLSGLLYVFSVFAVYGLGRALYGSKTALFCAAIYLCSPLAILSSQFVRMYALLSLLSILSTWLYLQFSVKLNNSRWLFVVYVLVNALGTFTHIAFFFVLFAQIVFHLLFYRRTKIISFVAAVAISLLPYTFLWAPVLIRQFSKSAEGIAWVNKPDLPMMAELVFLYGGVLWLLIPVLLYLWWRSGSEPFRSFSQLRVTSLPLWLLAIAILTPLLISVVKPIFNSRLAIIGVHLFALTIGAIVGTRANKFLSLLLLGLTAIGLVVLHPGVTNCDNRATAAYLSQKANNGDVVIFTSLTRLPIDYYLDQLKIEKNLFETSFPAEIDQHPGYEGRITDPSRRAALEREGRELVESLARNRSQNASRRIFFLHGVHPEIDSIVEKALRERFELLPGEGVKCELSPYFKEVSVYR